MKAIVLFSGGMDSPVASVIAKRKADIIPLHFFMFPFYSKLSLELVVKSLKKLRDVTNFKYAIFFPWKEILRRIINEIPNRKYQCVICKKTMLKVAEKLARKERASAIVTGESLAQKASQTLDNIIATSYGIDVPIWRPLLGFDKDEIEKKAKEFSVWLDRHAGCCSAVPRYPVTHAKKEIAEKFYNDLRLDELIKEEMKKLVKIRKFDNMDRVLEAINL